MKSKIPKIVCPACNHHNYFTRLTFCPNCDKVYPGYEDTFDYQVEALKVAWEEFTKAVVAEADRILKRIFK